MADQILDSPILADLFAPTSKVTTEKPKATPKVTVRGAAPRKAWDNYQEVAWIQKSDKLRFVIAACTREGYRCINIREFYFVKRDNVWKPGRDGIVIPLAAPLNKTRVPNPNNLPKIIHPLKELLLAIEQAAEVAAEMDLEDPDNAIWIMPKAKTKESTNENS